MLWFSDGAILVVDMAGHLKLPVHQPLRDPERFRKFYLDHGTIEWTGEIDIAPEFLYNVATQTIRQGNRADWEWGEPYPAEMLEPSELAVA